MLTPSLSTMERLHPRLRGGIFNEGKKIESAQSTLTRHHGFRLAVKALLHATMVFVSLNSLDSWVPKSATNLEYLRHIVQLGSKIKTYPQLERGLSILLREPPHTRLKGVGT